MPALTMFLLPSDKSFSCTWTVVMIYLFYFKQALPLFLMFLLEHGCTPTLQPLLSQLHHLAFASELLSFFMQCNPHLTATVMIATTGNLLIYPELCRIA